MDSPTEAYIAIHNAFDPFQPIPPDKLDIWFVERPRSPLGALLTDLDPRKLPKQIIFVGHPFTGKSTELTKLAAELADRFDYFVVRINLEQNLDVETANPVEVIFLLGAAIYKVAHVQLEEKPEREHLEALKQGLETLVRTETDNEDFTVNLGDLLSDLVCFGAGLVAGSAGERVAQAATRPFRFISGTDVEVVRRLEVEPRVEQMLEHLNDLVEDVELKAERPMALIVDGLDKVRDEDVIALNFADKKFLADLPCRVVYTAPIWVYYSPRFAGVRGRFPVREFPNVKLHKQGNREQRDEAGYQAMREVVYRRLRALDLEPDEILDPTALDMLIKNSGGIMRDLIRMVREATTNAEIAGKGQIDQDAAEKAVVDWRRQYDAQLTPRYRKVLQKVEQTHQRTDDEECDELLQGNFILSYLDGIVWYDVHSILW